MTMNKVDQVVIFGGTHGDEMSGVFLLKKWLNNPTILKQRCPTCPITPFLANPEAIRLCRRYKDCDLNRQFTEKNLSATNDSSLPYEVRRAQELYKLFSDNESECKLLMDLHNTTANMKCCIILEDQHQLVSLHLAAYIQRKFGKDECKILTLGADKPSYCSSTMCLAKYGICVEIGPQPQGVLRADICNIQEKAVFYGLEFVKKLNEGYEFDADTADVYQIADKVDFPRDENHEITGMIHADLQDQDYNQLSLSDPVFTTMDDKVLTLGDVVSPQLATRAPFYPVFVNEASYYEKDLAFWLTEKKSLDLCAVRAKLP